ncbi:hypothetical protein D6T64_07970 [Cryobacterium melibiosiphilum]|uniref:Uncharacterized protein n=1 Tax=Cryobacterium melibiosiphilum TaxID=995039 RepID=A0A3A5MGC2_9MICO|nr:hypothetical protein [Cryobacterium melibiosiphilum]RJT89187.1 hypothetical protein D6T64_07970 [Cryobacterium melibiosiphilum]
MSVNIRKWLAVGVAFGGGLVIAIALAMFVLGASNTLTPPTQASGVSAPPWTPAPATATPAPTTTATAPDSEQVAPTDDGRVDTAVTPFDVSTQDNYELPADLPADQVANAHVGMQTNAIAAVCMQEAGFAYTYTPWWSWTWKEGAQQPPAWTEKLSESEQAGARLALYGDTGAAADYHWDDAGCWGYAVHTMGNDNAH